MEYRKITAIIRRNLLEEVERRLQDIGVRGISVTHVKGYGEYADFYSSDWNVLRARIEVFARKDRAEEIATAMLDGAHTGLPGDGVIAVLPVEKVLVVRTRAEPGPGEI